MVKSSGSQITQNERMKKGAAKRERTRPFSKAEAQRHLRLLRDVTEGLQEVFWICNFELTEMIYISPAYEQVWGRSCRSLYERPASFLEAIHPEDRPRVLKVMAQRRCIGKLDLEYRIIRPDGAIRWIWDQGYPLPATKDAPARVVGMAQDITERKRVEAELHARQGQLTAAQSLGAMGSWEWDPASDRLIGSEEFYRIFGVKRDELPPTCTAFLRLVVPQDRPALQAALNKALEGKQNYSAEYRIRRPDGAERAIHSSGALLQDGERARRLVGVIQDISEQREAQDALRESEERLRLIAQASNDGMWDWDLRAGRIWWNERYDQLFGPRPPQSSRNLSWWTKRLHPQERKEIAASFKQALASRASHWSSDYRLVRPDGRIVFVHSRCYFIRSANGKAVRVVGAMLDTTPRRQADQELQQMRARLASLQDQERRRLSRELHDSTAQKLAALGIRFGMLEEAIRDGASLRDVAADCRRMVEECSQEVRSVARLLHPPLLDELGLEVALDTYVTDFARRCGLKVTLEVDPGVQRLPQEIALTLFRVVQESLSNVLRHSQSSSARVQLARARKRVLLEVSDLGRGIPPRMLERFRRRQSSSGMGLNGMRERLEQFGGTLELSSSDRGTTVRAILPASADRAPGE